MGRKAPPDGEAAAFAVRLRSRYRITTLILFGSRAAGTSDEWSDYDFVVVSPDFDRVPFLDRLPDLYEMWEARAGVDVLCYTPAEFKRLCSQIGIVREAARTGVRII